MKLINFSFSRDYWTLNKLDLGDVNLLVGKNAVGKSKTILGITQIVLTLLQQYDTKEHDNFWAVLEFTDNDEHILYGFTCIQGKITREHLYVDNQTPLKRDETKATLHGEEINPPANKLVLHVRRDTIQYPYIEKVMQWAENSYGLLFNETDFSGDSGTNSYLMAKGESLFNMVKALPVEAIKEVKEVARTMNYPVSVIEAVEVSDLKAVKFIEDGVEKTVLWDTSLSKGMFRTLYLLIFVKFLASQKKPQMLLIDDLCEGLDYDRATKLGKYIFDFCLEHNIQLVASSNDSFLMDVVDIDYWNILQRDGSTVTAINKSNNPQLFEDFSFTGLNNFDLFSSDFIARHAINNPSKQNE